MNALFVFFFYNFPSKSCCLTKSHKTDEKAEIQLKTQNVDFPITRKENFSDKFEDTKETKEKFSNTFLNNTIVSDSQIILPPKCLKISGIVKNVKKPNIQYSFCACPELELKPMEITEEIIKKGKKLILEIIESAGILKEKRIYINPGGIKGSLRKAKDGITFFGTDGNTGETVFL